MPINDQSDAGRCAPGRPRSAKSHQAILDAAQTLLAERGIFNLTIEAIAERAGVSKASIYRRWPNKNALVVAVMLDAADAADAQWRNASPREELRNRLIGLSNIVNSTGCYLTEIIAAAQTEPELAELFSRDFVRSRREQGIAVLRRGVAQREFSADLDVELAYDALFGPIFYHVLMTRKALAEAYIDRLLALVLR